MYYSTGKSAHLPKVGATVENIDDLTAKILIKKGAIVDSLDKLGKSEEIVKIPSEETKQVVKKKGNPNWGKK